jgi:hypothetical protein
LAVLLVLVLCATAVAGSFGFYFSPAAASELPGAAGAGGAARPEGSVVGLFNNLTGKEVDGLLVRFSQPVTPVNEIGVGAMLDLVSNESGQLLYAGRAVPNATWEIDWYAAGERLEYAAWMLDGKVVEEICTHCPTASFRTTGQFLGEEFVFDASASGDPDTLTIARYIWTWSDGVTAEGVAARRVFDEPGEYAVTLTVVDADGNEDTRTERLTVPGCELDIAVSGIGAVLESPAEKPHAYGTLVILTATPALGWHFVGWSGDLSGGANPVGLTMDGGRTVTATFEIDTFTIAASASGNGSISPTGDATVACGSDLTFIITPNAHNHIADVLVDGTSVGAVGSYTFANVTVGHTIQAAFAVDQETLTVSTAGSGTVSRTPDASSYAWGTAVNLTATPALGWHFVGWSGDLTGSANPAGLTMDGSKMLSAMFVADLTVQILDRSLSIYRGTYATLRALTSPGASCTIAVVLPSGATSAAAGLTPKVADAGGIVSWTWLVAGNTLPGMGSITVTASAGGQVRQDVVSWSVLPHEYSLGVTVAGSGSVARSPDQAMYDFGTVVTLTANPAAGWHFVSWSGDATGSTSPVSVTVNENKNVTAAFEQDPSSLTVQILDRALAVYRGNNATMSAQTLPGASCSIVVMLPSGRASTAAGLGPKVAGADGKVSWTWLVGGTTATGAGSITVTATLGINTAQDTVSWTVLTH